MPVSYPQALRGVGFARYTDAMSASIALSTTPDAGVTIPAGADYAVIICADQAIHYNTQATTATTDHMKWPVNTPLEINGNRKLLDDFRAIEATASASLYINYYSSS